MTDRINLPLDPESWPGTPEWDEIQRENRERFDALRLQAYEDDLDRRYLRR